MNGVVFGGKVNIEEGMAYRKALETSGRKFIRLRLIDFKVRRMQAIKILQPIRGRDANGLVHYDFKEISGQLVFEPTADKTDMTADVLDCEFNRRFLASHTAYKFWEIIDEKIRGEIEGIAQAMAEKAIRDKKAIKKKEEVMSDEQLEYEFNRLNAERAKRGMAKMESGFVRPTKNEEPETKPEDPHRNLTPGTNPENQGKLKGKKAKPMISVE